MIIAVVIAGVIAIAYFGHLAAKKRREAIQQLCQRRGLRFDPDHDRDLEDRYPAFKCLSRGSDRYAYNILTGHWDDRPFIGFDYHYETYSTDKDGKHQTHHHYFSGVILDSAVPLKELFIRPEGFFDKVTEFFGYDDIDFESAEFSKKFYVKAEDKRWAYDVIHQDTMHYLLHRPRVTIQFDHGRVMAFDGSTFKPEEFESTADTVAGILDRLPGFLIEQQKA